uniref:ABC transporter ATP-binding protein n=1 Tax=candidate division WOR-3 bacterium TaxID=2052148 RepID=A0A7C3Z2E3_UNCW3
MKLVSDFWRREKGWFLFLIFMTIFTTAANLSFPYILKEIIDGIQKQLSGRKILEYVVILLFLGLARSILSTLLPFLRGKTNERFAWLCRARVFSFILNKNEKFFNQFPPGDVIERLEQDLNDLSWFSCSGIFRAIEGGFTLLLGLVILLRINAFLTLLALLPLSLAGGFWSRIGGLVLGTYRRWREKISEVCNYLESSLSGVKLLKAFRKEGDTIAKFLPILQARISGAVQFAKSEAKVSLVFRATAETAILIILCFGGFLVIKNRLTIGEFVAFMAYIGLLVQPFWDLGNFFVTQRRGKVAEKRIRDLAEFPEVIKRQEGERCEIRGFQFVNVEFAYDSKPVLSGVSLEIKEGMKVGIAGPVGSGKTTIAKLLLRLLEPKSGEIRVITDKGILSLMEIDLSHLRSHFGYCPQEPSLFSDTLKNNILFGREELAERLNQAIEISGLVGEIKAMPGGVDSLIGERGIKLSGGQKERVAIARAILSSPRILILDDATASLDAEIEKEVVANLLKAVETLILITHRLSLLSLCDVVYVLEGGKVEEKGKPEELIAQRGLYWRLYERQLLKERLKEDEAV